MSRDNRNAARVIQDTLVDLPLIDRMSALVCSIIADDPRAMQAVCNIVSVAGIMARQLPPPQRLAIAWALLDEIERINAKWN